MKHLRLSAILLLVVMLCGCAAESGVTLTREKVRVNYSARYEVTAANGISYENTYTVKTEDGRLVISSLVEAAVTENGEIVENAVQTITAKHILYYDEADGCYFGVPESSEEEFTNTADETQYTAYSFTHNHKIKSGSLKIKEYSSSEEAGYKETLYTVALSDKYYDKDTLAFLAAAFNEQTGVIKLCSGNRDKLQAVRYEILEDETVSTECGDFLCKCMRIRPNTDFSVNSALIYFDSVSGIPVKVVQNESVMLLKSAEELY